MNLSGSQQYASAGWNLWLALEKIGMLQQPKRAQTRSCFSFWSQLNMKLIARLLFFSSLLAVIACTKSSNDVTFGPGGSDGGSGSGGTSAGGEAWHVDAVLVSNGCNDRVSPVTQDFTFSSDGSSVNTTLVDMPVTQNGGTLEATFSESDKGCLREYTATFANISDSVADVQLSAKSTCSTGVCENTWQGTAQRTSAAAFQFAKVHGEDCNPNVPSEVGYRPSLFECNGNAAVLMGGSQRNNFSVVLRRNGGANDRDPANPGCGTNRCSPYKTQKVMELTDFQVNCLGETGYGPNIAQANRISIKYVGAVSNPTDTRQFEQYCLNDVTASLH